MPHVCTKCAKEPHIKALIEVDGQLGRCGICQEDGRVYTSANNRFYQLCKALIRFHYSEWDYNSHWGGDGEESLFYGPKNIFFNEDRAVQPDDYNDLVTDATQFGEVYEDYDRGVTIFAGYFEGQQNSLLRAIKSTRDPRLIELSQRLKIENHFTLEEELKAILVIFQHVATTEIKTGEKLYRARVGIKARKAVLTAAGFEQEYHYAPYTGSEIGAPPPNIASAGRANRAGVSFLYCATNEPTAIAEIRPHPGDRVSIGAFQVKRDLKAYDLSRSQLLHYFESDKLLDSYIPFNTLSTLINKTITPAERSQYSITQLIADCIRQLGFDAVLFESTVGSGINAVLFNSGNAELLENEGNLFLIDNVKYTFKPEQIIDPKGDYAEDFMERYKKGNQE